MNTAPGRPSPDSPKQLHWRSRIARKWNVVLILFLTFVVLPLGSASPASAGAATELFNVALRAQDFKDWKKSAELLERALKKQPENGELVRRYGTIYAEYLPNYYIGLALFHQGDCAGALRKWDLSLRIGAIQTATPEYDTLLRLKTKCTGGSH